MIRLNWLMLAWSLVLVGSLGAADEKKGNAEEGKGIFEAKCSLCHNHDSTEKKIGPGLKGIKDGKLPSGKDATRENVMKNLNEGGGGMPAFEKLLSDEEKDNVVAYVMTL